MTKEQIEALNALKRDPSVSVISYLARAATALPRLLAERERLLSALRDARDDNMDPFVEKHIAEAIAFAEENA